jgi:biotin synthase
MLDKSEAPAGWHQLAERVLGGGRLSVDEGLAILRSPDEELLEIMAAAYRVRQRWFGNRVHLNFLINAKSGRCGEDCGYCSQSKFSATEISEYEMLDEEKILAGAEMAAQSKAGTYCVVISGRRPLERDLATIESAVHQIKQRHGLKICVSVGLLKPDDARRLKDCGVDRINHNLNSSQRFYPKICTTHEYQDRLDTLLTVKDAQLQICSGGIVGLGEDDTDVVELALRLGEFGVEALPVNFLIPIAGTPLADAGRLNPRYCLKVLALFRLANPECDLRIAAGRELHLGSLQPLGLFAASSIFVGDYLTTKGQPPREDYQMIEDLGFEVVG